MNAWFERLREAAVEELGVEDAAGVEALGEALTLSPGDSRALLELARDVAHGSGARHFAPLTTYLAGRVVAASGATDEAGRARAIAALARAAARAGQAPPEG